MIEKLQCVDFIFIDRKLEKNRKQLLNELLKFTNFTKANFFVHDIQRDYYELNYHRRTQDGDPEARERFVSLTKEIDDVGSNIYQTYSKIAILAQKKL